MRRLDVERNDTGGRGFRIIEASGRYLEPLTPPPPPRAPEPYKVASTSSSLGRAHRRSSFVIIAETRPATPNSRSNSPAGSALASLSTTGRVSPFRGRGFRGPLPHAQSRSQSPDNRSKNGREYGRFDRRASVSQQNSPRRSLIPQPTRRRSVSLTKNIETKKSPKFGRRAIPRKSANSTVTTNSGGSLSRRHSLKAPDLSPIQGTPTKPAETRNISVRDGKFQNAKISPTKTRSNLAVPRNPSSLRKPLVQEKSSSKETTKPRRFVEEKRKNVDDDATTKIPMRRGSIVNRNGAPTISTNRFVSKNPKSTVRSVKPKETQNPEKSNENGMKENTESSVEVPGTRFIDIDVSSEPKKPENDLKLVELLKQSSGATGTSSVVNATTTTAVQPLQIDADRVKNQESTINKNSISAPSPASREVSPNSKEHSPSLKSENSPLPRSPKPTNSNQDKKIDNREKNGAGSSTIGSNANSTNQKKSRASPDESSGNSTKKEPSNGNGTKEKNIVTSGSKKNLLTRNTVQETNKGEMRIPSANPGSRGSNGNSDNSKINDQAKSEKMENAKIEEPSSIDVTTSGNSKEDNRNDAIITENEDSVDPEKSQSKNAANGKNVETTTKNNVRSSSNGNDKVIANNGSENSLKSSNGLSTTSVESTRSTDTGVSVNTVRGVSSAREKKGMHMMKRSEEIETLSGNVMHLERNGEAAVLDVAESPEEPQDQTRLGRFKKSLTNFRDRFPSMRWPGCRRNQKSHPAWIEDHQNHSRGTQRTEHENPDDSMNSESSRSHRIWSRLKNSCRCTRFRGCNCCRRAARVAPAESTSCCPPERRCGALCGRIFSRCRCKKNKVQHTRSIRAKHSLTSVAPPPLSEEHKSKIPEVLVEHNSVMRGAIPCLPVPIAWFCLVWNVLVPGTGTIWSGLFNLCVGQPRFAISASPRARFGALVVNLMVGVGQFFTVLFCLVGWGWSIWWGVTMIRLARKYKRFRASEAASNDLEARAGEPTGLPPGVPSQALRGMERAR